ncbi:hypothetical protein EDB89DRAFT_2231385 [Lactarius sanguifluus]|nr:hypothetical protein EDB89DRAFT_2231385 [Lactarius sanguifluus]
MRPELNSVLQCLSLNGYSVFSLIDDILAHGCNQEDPGIKLLREGVERDAANICARLLNHNPTSSSVSAWALGFAQATLMTFSLRNNLNHVVSPNFSSGIASTSTGGPERFLNMGRVLFKNHRYGATIDMLPDNVLLEIFDFCLPRNLVTLKVKDMYQNGYISPEAMVGSLAVLTRLKTLSITLATKSPPSDQRRCRPDPPMRTILPALTAFQYRGYSEYLEDFLVQIDTPRVDDLKIEYFTHQIQAPELSRFIDRTENLKLDQFSRAEVTFYRNIVDVELNCSQGKCRHACLFLEILDQPYLNTQVPGVAHVLCQLVPTFSNVDHLYAHGGHISGHMNIADWLPFFRLFPAAETLHLFGGVATYIFSALEDGADSEMTTNVFPALHLIRLDETTDFYEDSDCDEPVGPIERFLSSRQLSGRPVTVVDTEGEFDRRC